MKHKNGSGGGQVTYRSEIKPLKRTLGELLMQHNDHDWALTPDQLEFMSDNHELIMLAYQNENMKVLRDLSGSVAYISRFGAMSWDEAFDRYESWLEKQGNNKA